LIDFVRKYSLDRDEFVLIFLKGLAALSHLVVAILISTFFGDDVLSRFTQTLSMIVILSIIARLGGDNLIIKECSGMNTIGSYCLSVVDFRISIVSSSILGLLFFILSYLIIEDFLVAEFLAISIGVGIATISLYLSSLLRSKERQLLAIFFEPSGWALLSLPIILCLLVLDVSLTQESVSVFIMVSILIPVFFALVRGALLKPNPDGNIGIRRGLEHRLRFNFFTSSVFGLAFGWGVLLASSFVLSVDDYAVFILIFRLIQPGIFLQTAMNSIYASKFSALWKEGDRDKFLSIFNKLLMNSSLFFLLYGVLLIPLSKLHLLEQVKIIPLVIVLFGQGFNVFSGPVVTVLNMIGGHMNVLLSGILSTIALIIIVAVGAMSLDMFCALFSVIIISQAVYLRIIFSQIVKRSYARTV